MSDLSLYPVELAEMSVNQLANLSPERLQEASFNLDELIAWAKKAKVKLDTALEQRFGEQARQSLLESGRDFGTAHFDAGPLRVTFDLPKRVSWDQKKLADIAERVVAAGERVQDYMDVELSVSESAFNNWPPALKDQFAPARTVKPGKPGYRLTISKEIQS
jgi:hypothetical protein